MLFQACICKLLLLLEYCYGVYLVEEKNGKSYADQKLHPIVIQLCFTEERKTFLFTVKYSLVFEMHITVWLF